MGNWKLSVSWMVCLSFQPPAEICIAWIIWGQSLFMNEHLQPGVVRGQSFCLPVLIKLGIDL